MVELTQLWLPILLSAFAVFFISFAMWMVLPHHRSDWEKLPDEDGLMEKLRSMGATNPQYAFPHCASPEQMKDPEWAAKYKEGPSGFVIVRQPGHENLGKSLGTSFAFNLITAFLVAYVASMGVQAGATGAFVFRFVFTVALLANSFGLVWGAIWFARTWKSTLKEIGDGCAYAVATAAIFAAFWPAASSLTDAVL